MKLTNRLLFLPAFLFMTISAYGQDVHYNYDCGANFEAFKTYQWADSPSGAVPDQLIDQAIKRAVDGQLAEKALTKVERNADVYVSYQAAVGLEKGIDMRAWVVAGAGGAGVGGARYRAGPDFYYSRRHSGGKPA